MLLRRAVDAELPEVVSLVNTAFRGSDGWAVEGRVVEGPRITLAGLREDIAAKPEALQMVWRNEADERLLGSVWLEPLGEDVWYLGLLCVQPDAQTRQLGRTLLAAAEDEARQRGARRMRISVMNVRDTLMAWYERRGYVKTGETKPFPYGDERVGKPLRADLAFVILEKEL
jgi:GNAT superfamily N-acetyltransferase